MDIDALKHIYFLGIGGIGMSALARYFNQKGLKISGYDKTETSLTKKLVAENIDIHYQEDISKIPDDIDLVVFTPAIPKTNLEWKHLKNTSLKVLKRSEVLGLISRNKRCIAVAGTHGKTTTSSMVAHILKSSGLDISCFLGGIAKNFDSNYCYGESEWTVIEADEFDRSFHTLRPEIAILISMDPDHLDIYGEKENMQTSFEQFLLNINSNGVAIVNYSLLNSFSVLFLEEMAGKNIRILSYGAEGEDYKIGEIDYEDGVQKFQIRNEDQKQHFEMEMPGEHNANNMCAAIGVSEIIGVDIEKIKAGVKTFSGIKRRFEIQKAKNGRIYIDDYAHHPMELRAAIGSVRQMWPKKKLKVIFQPHLYSRTQDFMEEFAVELEKVDDLMLMEIYPARELPIKGVNAQVLLEKIALKNKRVVQKEELMNSLKLEENEVLMTLGAGDIDVFAPMIREWIEKND